MENINDSFFDGVYKDLWRSIIPDMLTQKEVDFMISYFNLKSDDCVLDLMCGYGRHTLALARMGVNVTAVDNLRSYIDEICDVVEKEDLPVEAVCSNVLTFQTQRKFDLAICMGNSLNFYNRADTTNLLKSVAKTLKRNGSVLINSWSLAEIVSQSFREESEGVINGILCTTRSRRYLSHLELNQKRNFLAPLDFGKIKSQSILFIVCRKWRKCL